MHDKSKTMEQKQLSKIEFWIASFLYGFALVLLITNTSERVHTSRYYEFLGDGVPFSYFSNYFVPELFRFSILYFTFLILNFLIIPSIFREENILLYSILTVVLFVFVGFTTGILKTYSEANDLLRYETLQQGYNRMFFNSFSYSLWLIIIIAAYNVFKKFMFHIRDHKDREVNKNSQMILDAGFGLSFWFVGLLFWIASSSDIIIMVCWTIVILSAIGLVLYALYYYLPSSYETTKKFGPFFWHSCIITIITCVPIGLICFLFFGRIESFLIVTLFNLPTQLLLTGPLAWHLYKRRLNNKDQIQSLKTRLGKSDANLSFLQSQINPHFLFNALNTLYGTALQENAERTGEGIQKLGDMMRFMLHENMQDKISLTREVEYLSNYIELQKLRTSLSDQIRIETEIDDQLNPLQITPMLLIPFVENAFKHGISLNQPSHIKITLQTKENTLYFDVHNSIHLKPDHDPEKLKSGIGLENVKQRLSLLYFGKHELIIRESAKEFFVHLTLELD